MDQIQKDYEGIYKYKFIIPFLYVISWIGMVFGPIFSPISYRELCFVVISFLTYKSIMFVVFDLRIMIESFRVLKRAQSKDQKQVPLGLVTEQIYHAFVIPSYKQDIDLIAETLNVLAKHKRAESTYLVFLAMEAHEEGSDKKAETIINKFRNKFRHMDYTRHQVRPHEQKGKASNVSWCVEHLEEKFKSIMVNEDNVFLTILDVDSWAPNVYFDEVEDHIRSDFENRDNMFFQPPQIFTRNHLEVPLFSRVYDQLHSSGHISSSYSCFGMTFPISNYTVSYNLMKSVGFWDTNEDAIGQDLHTFMKCMWKTEGKLKGISIYAPFNQLNLSTGGNIWQDLKARFWQAERHARGIADVAYMTNMLTKSTINFKTLLLYVSIMEIFFLTVIPPWMFISFQLQNTVYSGNAVLEETIHASYFNWMLVIASIANIFMFAILEVIKIRSSRILYGVESGSFFRFLEMAILYTPGLLLFTVPPFVIAAFAGLKNGREYVVAKKDSERKIELSVDLTKEDSLVSTEESADEETCRMNIQIQEIK